MKILTVPIRTTAVFMGRQNAGSRDSREVENEEVLEIIIVPHSTHFLKTEEYRRIWAGKEQNQN